MKFLLICLLAALCSRIEAQATSSVELLGTIPASQALSGLGFNLDAGEDWQWAAAAAAGATHARIQCSWSGVEQQTKPPQNVSASPRYIQDPKCAKGFESARRYGIHPTVVAAYGPPFHSILTVGLAKAAEVGATTLSVAFVSGVGGDTLASLKVPYDYIAVPGARIPFTSRHSYQGTFISGSKLEDGNYAMLTLASAVRTPLAAGTRLTISEVLYPSAITERANDPSVLAYGDYVMFLASDMAARGVTGDIELWNEPPWTGDPWDNRCLLYDDDLSPCPALPGSPVSPHQPNYGFVANLQRRTMPPGVTLTWNGTSGSGWGSILHPRMFAATGVYAAQPATVVTKESFHPYGFEPEQMMWTTACLERTAFATTHNAQNIANCYLPGAPPNANFAWAVQADMIAKASNPAFGVSHEITETGIIPPSAGLSLQQARFVIRQFLGFEADGVTPVEFYKLYDRGTQSDPNFSFVEQVGSTTSYTPKPSYTAISGFMADIKPIGSNPAKAYSAETLPAVVSYSGTFPLSTVNMVGARSGAQPNSDAFMVWQRSFSKCTIPTQCGVWITQAPPASAPVTISIPGSMRVTQVVNLTTREKVSYKESGRTISFMVADDPVEVLVDPSR